MNHIAKRANSTTHGLTSSEILRCRVQECFYWNVCPIKHCLEQCYYGYKCIIELERFKVYRKAYGEDLEDLAGKIKPDEAERLIDDLSMTEILALRADNALSLTGLMPEGKRGLGEEPFPNVLWRYRSELYRKRIKLFEEVRMLRSSVSPSS